MHRFFVKGHYNNEKFETVIAVPHRRDLFSALAKQYGVPPESLSLRKVKCSRLTPENNREDLKEMLVDALHTLGCDDYEDLYCCPLKASMTMYGVFGLSLEEVNGVLCVVGFEGCGGTTYFFEEVGDRPLVAVVKDGLASIEEFVA